MTMKRRLVKPILAIALGLAVLAPNATEAYATSQTSSEQAKSEAQKEFEIALKKAEEKYAELVEAKKTVAYVNADGPNRQAHDNNIENLDKKIKAAKSTEKTSDSVYESYTKILNDELTAIASGLQLDGEVVDRTELHNLYFDLANFTTTEAYKAADRLVDRSLVRNYNDARDLANAALAKGDALSKAEYDKALSTLKAAVNAIKAPFDLETAKEGIKAEVEASRKVDQSLYTDKTARTFKSALRAAETTANIADASAQQLNEATETLKAAREALVKKPTNADEQREAEIKELREALERNEVIAQAGQLLLDKYPETIKNVKKQLEDLIKTSKELSERTNKLIQELENAPRG